VLKLAVVFSTEQIFIINSFMKPKHLRDRQIHYFMLCNLQVRALGWHEARFKLLFSVDQCDQG